MQVTHIQALQHEPGPTGSNHQICGLSEPKTQHLYTLYLLTHCSPVISCTHPQEVMTCHTGTRMFEVVYGVSGQLRSLHFLT